jgi:DNA helicase-2/ATP-dependent DNA helicase PcrA
MDFLDQLNSTQRQAVTHTEGPSLIVAGAGSGKTRVLTYRVAYLLTQGVPAGNILALTFTNKAAREMKERICRLVPPDDARYLWMGTFHHVCTRLLRRNAERLGFTPDFTIYDTQDMKSLLKSICKERGLDDKIYKPAAVLERISMAKNMMISPERYALDSEIQRRDRESRLYEMATIYDLYQLRLKAANAMDFDDLLLNMLRLIDQHADIREQLQQQFRYVLVDEYQDTNYVQYLLVSRLAEPQNNICVVGDDAQSIYSFRGADIRNILNFRQRYPDAQIFKLERNYRSTRNIVDAANSLIHHNQHQIEKNVYSENDEGQLLSLHSYMDDRAEAEGVARQIQNLKKGSSRLSPLAANRFTYDDFAVLYRTNAQSRAFEGELRKRNIPYRIYGGISFYQRKEIKDTLGYFRLAVNPRDNEALLRIIAFPGRGIGDTTMKKVAANAIEHHRCYLDVMRMPEETGLDVGPATQKKISAFARQIDELGALSEQMDAFGFAEHVLRTTGVMTALAMDRTPEGIDRAQNVQELLNAIHEFVEMRAQEGIDFTPITDFLSEVSLQTDQDDNLQDTTERVTLMTVHAAKGLEFPVVFIVGLEENLFPSQYCVRPSEIEEERRLLYVAITRSMEQCHLSLARQRFRNGSVTFASPSRFLSDIDRRYIEMVRPASSSYRAPSFSAAPRFVQPTRPQVPVRNESVSETKTDVSWQSGDRVHHSAFGNGVVSRVYHDEATGNDKIEINFEGLGTKTLLLSYAKLERI